MGWNIKHIRETGVSNRTEKGTNRGWKIFQNYLDHKWLITQCHRSFNILFRCQRNPMVRSQYVFKQMYCRSDVSVVLHQTRLSLSVLSSFPLHASRKTQRVLTKWKYNHLKNKLLMIEHLIKITSELLITGLGLFTISEIMKYRWISRYLNPPRWIFLKILNIGIQEMSLLFTFFALYIWLNTDPMTQLTWPELHDWLEMTDGFNGSLSEEVKKLNAVWEMIARCGCKSIPGHLSLLDDIFLQQLMVAGSKVHYNIWLSFLMSHGYLEFAQWSHH